MPLIAKFDRPLDHTTHYAYAPLGSPQLPKDGPTDAAVRIFLTDYEEHAHHIFVQLCSRDGTGHLLRRCLSTGNLPYSDQAGQKIRTYSDINGFSKCLQLHRGRHWCAEGADFSSLEIFADKPTRLTTSDISVCERFGGQQKQT